MSARAKLQAAWDRVHPLSPRTVFLGRGDPTPMGKGDHGWWARCAAGSLVWLGRYSAEALAKIDGDGQLELFEARA